MPANQEDKASQGRAVRFCNEVENSFGNIRVYNIPFSLTDVRTHLLWLWEEYEGCLERITQLEEENEALRSGPDFQG